MNDWFIWNGVKCTEYGIHVLEQPPMTIPAERATFTNIPGRSGSLTTLEGDAVYDDLLLTAQCLLPDPAKIPAVAAWLRGGGKVTFANRPGGFYHARIVNQIPFEKVLRGNSHRSFSVNFRCKPFWYQENVPAITVVESGAFITNPGTVASEPVVTVYAEQELLLRKAEELLEAKRESISAALEAMLGTEDLKQDGEAIYLPPFYYAEIGVAAKLKRLAADTDGLPSEARVDFERLAKKTGLQYDEIQKDAILKATVSKVMVLTGGPGTGKTTTTLGMIAVLRSRGKRILLAAPTGRAAKRMTETTGMEARTIHRLLEFKPPEGYQRDEENRLEGDVLIVDECSMIDVILMNALLKAIPPRMQLILVGDVDQLPSVGAGNVLRDIIDSGVFPVVRLTRIFRQAQSSRIILNAHRINAGEFPDLSNGAGTDFFFVPAEEPETAAQEIVRLVKTRLPKYRQVLPSEIQVLTPMQRGAVGAANLNTLLQEALNPSETCLRRSGYSFRLYDKVMQIRNNYDKEVFNGDVGTISALNLEERNLRVRFDDREVEYDVTELDELAQAYAVTIHKSQGSEYPIVVMPMLMTHFVMLQRNLLYTGVTRAKKLLVLVGTKKAVGYAVRNVTVTSRNTRLKERLQA